MAATETMLQQSVRLCEELLGAYQQLSALLGKRRSRAMMSVLAVIREYHAELEQCEHMLEVAERNDGHPDAGTDELLEKRRRLMEALYAENRSVEQKIRGAMASVSDEIAQTVEYRRMTSGYSSSQGGKQAGERICQAC